MVAAEVDTKLQYGGTLNVSAMLDELGNDIPRPAYQMVARRGKNIWKVRIIYMNTKGLLGTSVPG